MVLLLQQRYATVLEGTENDVPSDQKTLIMCCSGGQSRKMNCVIGGPVVQITCYYCWVSTSN